MRVYGQNGKGSGKLGSSVYSINHGVQIKREYNGTVSNPNTPDQVAQRSRFKLASQVSAALAPVIVIPRRGIYSPRNLFVKKNFDYFYATSEGAQVSYDNLQITPGSGPCPRIEVIYPESGSTMTVKLAEDVSKFIDHVVYNIFEITQDMQMILTESKVVVVDSDHPNADTTFPIPSVDYVVYAYGMRMNSARAKAKFGNYQVKTGQDVAELVANRRVEISDVTFSATRGVTVLLGEEGTPVVPPGSCIVYVTAGTGGSVSAQGLENGRIIVQRNANVTLEATNDQGWHFEAWYINGEQTPFSRENVITLTVTQQMDIYAAFGYGGGLE